MKTVRGSTFNPYLNGAEMVMEIVYVNEALIINFQKGFFFQEFSFKCSGKLNAAIWK